MFSKVTFSKMAYSKIVFSVLVGLVCSNPAGAATKSILEKLKTDVRLQMQNRDSKTKLRQSLPVRQAKVRVHIMKSSYTQSPDGTFSFVQTPVCNVVGSFNVYDIVQNPDLPSDLADFRRLQCAATLNGKAVQVNVGGMVFLMNNVLFDVAEDFKANVSFLYIDDLFSPSAQWQVGAVATTDMGNHSLMTDLSPSVSTSCVQTTPTDPTAPTPPPTCQASLNEYFSAMIDVQD